MKILLPTAFLCLFLYNLGNAQALDPQKKQVNTHTTLASIAIDGSLKEEAWQDAVPATDLIQLEPRPGEPASERSEIRVLYDNTGIYIGARLYDSNPGKILKELTQRDQIGNADWFGIFLDPYRDGINGVGFIVSASGVQFDAKYSTFGEDPNWDGVWESATSIDSEGWVAELKIPYSALRFPNTPEQTWHVNFGRLIQRLQEKSFWSPINPQQNGFLNQAGYLSGIKNIQSPVRLQATPYVAVYGQHYHDGTLDPKNSLGHSFNGGMDIKYGISDAFTLDLTLIPDFGEARSDNQVLNLSPFEVRFEENRPFFTEGTELFNKGGLFYSRRVGGRPFYGDHIQAELTSQEELLELPGQSKLYNATKISGRTAKGLGIGFFNATAGNTYARIRNWETGEERRVQADPLTNYNVLVFDQNLPHNSYVSFINTTVLRSGSAYDANVTGTSFNLRNKANSYAVNGGANVSQLYFPDSVSLGHTLEFGLRKTNGAVQFSVNYGEESDTYNPNDLGFLTNNNNRYVRGWVEYGKYQPFGPFNRAGAGVFMRYSMLYRPAVFTEYGIEAWTWAQTRNFWRINLFTYHEPFTSYDYFEPRTPGRYLLVPAFHNYGFFVRSDERKAFQFAANAGIGQWAETGRHRLFWYVEPRYRVNDHLTFSVEAFNNFMKNDVGFANTVDNGEGTEIIIGHRNRRTVENTFNTKYTFNNKMEITLRTRHYWSTVEYLRFHRLENDGGLGSTDYTGSHNTTFNAFNVDMVFRWRFAPGSDIFVVWKNSILSSGENPQIRYVDDLSGLFDDAQTNSLSLKVVYFLDYLNFVKPKTGF